MSASQLVLVLAWLSVAGSLTATVFWALPALARLRFVTQADCLRDECMDLVLDGTLPATPPVLRFLRVQDTFIAHSKHLTFWRIAVIQTAIEDCGMEQRDVKPTFAQLSPAQRKLMFDLEKRSVHNVRRYLRDGSQVGWLGYLQPERLVGKFRHRPAPATVHITSMDPQKLATKVSNEAWELATPPPSRERRARPTTRQAASVMRRPQGRLLAS